MSVAVVIVNYRTAALTVNCLASIAADGWLPGRGRVIVVDNASGDDSVAVIGQAIAANGWSQWVELIPAERNGGFAYGNNLGIQVCLQAEEPPGHILLLNPDTVVCKGALHELVSFLETNPQVGVAGGSTLDAAGVVQCSAHRFHSPLSELDRGARFGILAKLLSRYVVSPPQPTTPGPCDWVSGAFIMIRREVLETVGLLDEGYFLYFEEVDYCWRVKKAGWQVWSVPTAAVTHLEGQSTGANRRATRRAGYWYASRRRCLCGAYGWVGLAAADLLWCVGKAMFALRRPIQRKVDEDPAWHTWDILSSDCIAVLGRVWSRVCGREPA